MRQLSVAFHTLGCKLNQLETESLAAAFSVQGFRVVPFVQLADIYIVNTCTVTSKAEQKARRIIRKVMKENLDAVIIATGCYAQMDSEALRALDAEAQQHRLFVVSMDNKDVLLDLPLWLMDNLCGTGSLAMLLEEWISGEPQGGGNRFRFNTESFSFHSRASLKIQDGCDNSCSYCRVCLARGPSVSDSAESVITHAQALEAAGHKELVLTGINVTSYRDMESNVRFPGLLKRLLAETDNLAFRISSIEPETVNDDLLEALIDTRVRPHFHLSVQSGSDTILSAMRRHYRAEKIYKGVLDLRRIRQDPFLACDIIAGFPGETDEDFELSYSLCQELEFAWIHAFPFSPRPGTKAFSMKNQIPQREAVQRVERLLQLSAANRAAYIRRCQGREFQAIVESGHCPPGYFNAVSENYLKLAVRASDSQSQPKQGAAITICIHRAAENTDTEITEDTTIDAYADLVQPKE